MHSPSARVRAFILPAALVAGLLATTATSVAAAEPSTASTAATVAGTGLLSATGAGHVRLRGSYVVTGSIHRGTLRIDGIGIRTSVRVTGWTSRTRLADGSVIYRFLGTTGHYRIAGRAILTRIDSPTIRFVAAGHGRAWLAGRGTYRVNGGPAKPWATVGVTRTF